MFSAVRTTSCLMTLISLWGLITWGTPQPRMIAINHNSLRDSTTGRRSLALQPRPAPDVFAPSAVSLSIFETACRS
ncbi:hypothetical protein T484DRAFT_1934823 [Baffinella frigidus]|nr:hypothetical protein T484DRAFT_1934823 [Cryptophyta sp. CCMP2293]